MNWKPLTSIDELPRDRTFLIHYPKSISGISIYEAMVYDNGTIGDPANCDFFLLEEISCWCEIVWPDDNKQPEFVSKDQDVTNKLMSEAKISLEQVLAMANTQHKRVRIKIQAHRNRMAMIQSLATEGYKTWVEEVKSIGYGENYYVCFEMKDSND